MLWTTPRRHDQIVFFEFGHKVLPFSYLDQMIITEFGCFVEHALLDLHQLLLHSICQVVHTDINLLATKPHHHTCLLFLQITWSNLDTNWHTLLFPMCILPTRIVTNSIIEFASDILLLQRLQNFFAVRREILQWTLLTHNGNNDHLLWCHLRRQDQPCVVSVHHDHDTNRPRSQPPTSLPHSLCLPLLILIIDIEHFTKILS
mmetsp:Transcript_28536/g.60823  ORF Transcript_28536/g.60823 Transcript_28536/m.60823 type:complete len:203 (-) Transcript_28536:1531-2139(-)